RKRSGNQDPVSEETEDRPWRCPTIAEAAVGKSLSSNLGTESGKSGSSAAVVAPAPAGSDADPDHESATGHRQKSIAKVAMGRRLAVRLYWMWRREWDYQQFRAYGSNAGELVTGHGAH